jgi:type IV pilus assembly protein PilC
MVQAFTIVADGTEHDGMRKLINELRTDVASGTNIADALSKHPRQFDELFCCLVASGENSGTLETMLDRVATYKEKTEALKAKIKKALTYPTAVIVVAIVVTAILLVKVVPQFAETFQGFGSELPAFTLLVLALSDWVQAWWLLLLMSFTAAGYLFSQAKQRYKRVSDWVDALSLKLPIIGTIVHDAVIARFSRTLSTTFAAGVPLVEALDSTAGAAGNAVYARGIRRIRDDVTAGQALTASIRSTNLFPVMLLQMIAIGEESGSLDDMLSKVADHYEAAVDNAVDSLSSLMEPLIMSVLGVLVGGLMIAMYLPIFMLGSVI